MSMRDEQCNKVCRILDDVLANRPTERDALIVAVRTAFSGLERKTWKWMEFDSDEGRYDIIKCPCCKHIFTVDSYHWTDIGFIKDDFKFCPNCGADMRGEEE